MNPRIELYLLKFSGQPKGLTIDRKGGIVQGFMGIIGIKLPECAFTASIAKIVRKYRDISISEVKRIVSSNDHLISCDYIDAVGITKILNLRHDLESKGVSSVIYEHDSVTSVEFLLNSLASYEETAKQIETDMNNEALAAERK